jgi:pimeloyl-ACP methyl ester carboxylesterase
MRLLLVHGIGQGGQRPAELEQAWIDTLRAGYAGAGLPFPSSLSVDFPYYGDALDARVARSQLPLPQQMVPKGGEAPSAYEEFLSSTLDEMKERKNISDAEVAAEAGPIPAAEKGIRNWRLTQAIARLIDKRHARFTSDTIERYLRDVFLYISNRSVEREINAIVEAKLTDEPTVVIGHSLGSVVAYRVLVAQGAKVKLPRYVTVGSPLGIRTISSRLGVLKYPPADLNWYNAYDDGDIVALNPLKDPWFRTDPAITNYNGVRNTTDNQHGIVGYLNDATVARCIDEALTAVSP